MHKRAALTRSTMQDQDRDPRKKNAKEEETRGEVKGQGQQPEVIDTRILQSRNTKKEEEQDKEVEAKGRSKGGPAR